MSGSETATKPVRWRLFLRALANEADATLGAEARDALLRGVGGRMARLAPLPAVATLEALETEANEVLAEIGWGCARFEMDAAARVLRIVHAGLPIAGSAGGPHGPWFSAVLEGLYTAWFAQQPAADPGLRAQRTGRDGNGNVILNYSRTAM